MSLKAAVPKKPLGQWLLEERVVDAVTLQGALEDQAKLGGRLGMRLIASGKCHSRDVFRCLALQNNLDFVTLDVTSPQQDALAVLPWDQARALGVVPLTLRAAKGGLLLTVAVGDPQSQGVAAVLEKRVGMSAHVVLADPVEVTAALAPQPSLLSGEMAAPDPVIERLVDLDLGLLPDALEISNDELTDIPAHNDVPDALECAVAPVLAARVASLELQLQATRADLRVALQAAAKVERLEGLVEDLLRNAGMVTATPDLANVWNDVPDAFQGMEARELGWDGEEDLLSGLRVSEPPLATVSLEAAVEPAQPVAGPALARVQGSLPAHAAASVPQGGRVLVGTPKPSGSGSPFAALLEEAEHSGLRPAPRR